MTVKTRHTRFIQTETDPNVHNCDVLIKTISNFSINTNIICLCLTIIKFYQC